MHRTTNCLILVLYISVALGYTHSATQRNVGCRANRDRRSYSPLADLKSKEFAFSKEIMRFSDVDVRNAIVLSKRKLYKDVP